jgi:hypothetical protein
VTWPARVGMGIAVLAALAVGQTVDAALPVQHTDERPFVRAGRLGDRVHTRYAGVTVDAVHTAKSLDTPQGTVGTPGRWLIVDLTVVAWRRPLSRPSISLEDNSGRVFSIDPRSGYDWSSAPTGVRWRAQVPFEVPEDALHGATLVFSRDANDDRRDEVARIDLGIEPGDVAGLWDTQQVIELSSAQMATP